MIEGVFASGQERGRMAGSHASKLQTFGQSLKRSTGTCPAAAITRVSAVLLRCTKPPITSPL